MGSDREHVMSLSPGSNSLRRLSRKALFISFPPLTLTPASDINCKHEGRTYKNEETFRSQSGRSEFICDHGSVIKLGRRAEVGPPAFFPGCRMGGVLVSVGDVHYEEDEPLLCRQVDTAMGFGGLSELVYSFERSSWTVKVNYASFY